MGIFKRLKDMITANLNDMLDKIEEPEHAIDQMIKEMEESILELRKQTASSIASSKINTKKLDETKLEVKKWQKNAELAIVDGQDELAKKALLKKNELEAVVLQHETQLAEEEALIERMKSDLHKVEDKVQEARRKREVLLMKKRAADSKKKMLESSEKAQAAFDGSSSSIINGFDSFSKYEEKIERELAELEAREELKPGKQYTSLEAQFEHLQGNDDVDDELAALKKKLKK
ncbi:MAG: PspA/IM30 family protein [Lentisphaeraceae bacterium]|nr:PspA/IM30 family protein [Lentisphaeraceae bacterium]